MFVYITNKMVKIVNPEFNSIFLKQDNKNGENNQEKPKENKGGINKYDEIVPENEIGNFKNEIEQNIELKANELGFSKDELSQLAHLDLVSLEADNLKSLNLSYGNLEFIKDSITASINEVSQSDKADTFSEFLEFVNKHKKEISLAQLGIFLSSSGMPVLGELTHTDVNVEFYGENISHEDLVEKPELIKDIDQRHNTNTLFDILKEYEEKPLKYDNNSSEFRLEYDNDFRSYTEDTPERVVYSSNIEAGDAGKEKLNDDLKNMGLSLKYREGGIPLEKFIENKDEISKLIALDLKIPEEEIKEYINEALVLDTSKISIVPFNEFNMDEDLNSTVDSESEEIKAQREKFSELKDRYENYNNTTNIDKFEELLLKDLKDKGTSIEHLKEIAKDNPKEVLTILAKVLCESISYDYEEQKNMEKEDFTELNKKHAEGIPYATLKTNLGICGDYAETLPAAKYVLEKNDVPNLDRIMITYTSSDKCGHAWNDLYYLDGKGKIRFTSVDLTWADDENISKIPEKFNAVNKNHFYSSVITKAEEEYQELLKKRMEFNELDLQEKLRKMITTFDSELYKKEHGVKSITPRKTKGVDRIPQERFEI